MINIISQFPNIMSVSTDNNQIIETTKMKQQNEILSYVEHNINNTHTSIAKLFHKLYNKKYCVTTDSNKDKWFRFNGKYWESSNSIKHEIKNKLSSEIPQIIADVRSILRDKIIVEQNENSFNIERLKTMLHIEKNLYNTHFKDGVIKECESVFYLEKLPDIETTKSL